MAPTRTDGPEVLSRRRRLLILSIAATGFLLAGLDATVLNVALPTIQRSFHSSVSQLQWIVDAYTLVLASLLMLAGSLADRFGRRTVFQAGQILFTFGSLLCAVAPNGAVLIAFRVVQALGGTMLNPVSNAIVRNTFTEPGERARAYGLMGAMGGVTMALGPVVGGFLVSVTSWRVIFLINLPVGVAAVVLTARFIPDSRSPRPRRFDPIGQALIIVALAALTYAIIDAGQVGLRAGRVLALLICAVVSFVTLVRYELRRAEPLLEMRFFGSAPFSGAIATAIGVAAAVGGFLFLNTLYLQQARGLTPLYAALYTLPMAAAMALAAPLSGRLTARLGARPSIMAGGVAMLLSGLMLTRLSVTTPVPYLFVAYVLLGLGSSLITPPITNTSVSLLPEAQAGVAAAVTTTSRQSGSTLGVAIFGVLAGSGLSGHLNHSFAQATHAAWWIVAAVGAGVLAINRITNTAWASATARRTAERLREQDRGDTADHGAVALRNGGHGVRESGRR